MSAVWLKIITILCLYCSALTDTEVKGLVWRNVGEAFTIQCRTDGEQESLCLRMGLNEQFEVFFRNKLSVKDTVAQKFTGRLESNGVFPNMDIFIKNLSLTDTGPYWCGYSMYDKKTHEQKVINGEGSMLLVVTDNRHANTNTVNGCDSSHQNLVLMSVVSSAAVLLGIIIIFLIWIIHKMKVFRTTVKPRRVATNEVYEDMRGTMRR
ncbi:uncharacterized protein [Brachyistius frenatus]|uniref:uncharacterized protein isoform X1 n=1 Tax=Brachyistius frenatus TaxID=100188 RepID=UPI0037E9B92B